MVLPGVFTLDKFTESLLQARLDRDAGSPRNLCCAVIQRFLLACFIIPSDARDWLAMKVNVTLKCWQMLRRICFYLHTCFYYSILNSNKNWKSLKVKKKWCNTKECSTRPVSVFLEDPRWQHGRNDLQLQGHVRSSGNTNSFKGSKRLNGAGNLHR